LSLFITFEGGEGCGKSTQAKALWRRLSRLGISSQLTREPGDTALGNQLRRLLKRKCQDEISPEAELFLFAACRIQLVSQLIRPSLQQGKVVICDRFADSTTAYQGYGRRIDLATVKAINDLATQHTRPDLTVLLDAPATKGLGRKQASMKDRFETEEIAFHNRVRDGYLKLAAEEPERWLVIDATLPRATIARIIWDRVSRLLQAESTSEHG